MVDGKKDGDPLSYGLDQYLLGKLYLVLLY